MLLDSLIQFLVSSSITYYTSCAYSNKTKNNGYCSAYCKSFL